MNFKSVTKSLFAILFNFFETKNVKKYQYSETVYSNHFHIRLAANWLLKAQENSPDEGYSRCYSLYKKKWDRGYIETTGYIIPTMLQVADYLQDEKYKKSAMKAAEWLLEVQNSDGSFSDIDTGRKQVFDTGQCLFGLNYLYLNTKEARFLASAQKAGDWLISEQEENGSWIKHAYEGITHSYYTRVAASLIQLGNICKQDRYFKAGLLNIDWAISKQQQNGFFDGSSFKNSEKPILHTIIYVMEGLLQAYEITKESRILNSLLKSANSLKNINLHREIILFARYNKEYQAEDRSRCITGLAQWAGICLDLYKIIGDEDYLKIATRTIYFLKSKQIKSGKNTKGGFTGSLPFYAKYGSAQLLNWNNKFFLDTLLQFDQYNISVDDEHEEWVSGSFSFVKEVVSYKFSEADKGYLKHIEEELDKRTKETSSNITLVDLGCGKGKFIKYLTKKYPSINIIGIDPFFYSEESGITEGSAYKIPLSDNSIDIIITIEVLQHIKDIDQALGEMNRVLKDGSVCIIGERNPYSGLGLLKPIMERLGWWMYFKHSPFREKWFSKIQWKSLLAKNEFNIENIYNINVVKQKIPYLNRYYCIKSKK